LLLVVAACASSDGSATVSTTEPVTTAETASTTADVVAPTTDATTTTVSPSTSVTTTTVPLATTTTLPPPPVAAWDSGGVSEVALEFIRGPGSGEVEFVGLDRNMESVAEATLKPIGVAVSDRANAVLSFDLVWEALSADYETLGRCYSGVTLAGTVSLIDPQHPPVEAQVSFTIPPPRGIYESGCHKEWDDRLPMYLEVLKPLATLAITEIWQEAAFPKLMERLTEDYDGHPLYPQVAALEAFEGIDGEIDPADTAMFLGAVIDLIEYLIEVEGQYTNVDDEERAEAVAGRLLEAYAGVNYGLSTMADVQEWRDWLAEWG
jgi:hypothetical protein